MFTLTKKYIIGLTCGLLGLLSTQIAWADFKVVDTNQIKCYNDSGTVITCPSAGQTWHGQDGNYTGLQPSYTKTGSGTDAVVSDNQTGLMWQADFRANNNGNKVLWSNAPAICAGATTGGFDDWRVPTTKELYSLIDFTGQTPTSDSTTTGGTPYLNTNYFWFQYGTDFNERSIDSQFVASTEYVAKVMGNSSAFFGVNFADGRIKGYPTGPNKSFLLICVRGGTTYGQNDFVDNNDQTITDRATSLMWMKNDSGTTGLDWKGALAFCEDSTTATYTDWRLPNAKELQELVDYSHAPGFDGKAAINSLFNSTPIVNEGGQSDFGFYWSSTTHLDGQIKGTDAVYVAFGRALGFFNNQYQDVHGAGAQRGDPKGGDTNTYTTSLDKSTKPSCGSGPQGDCRRVYNLARCVRNTTVTSATATPTTPAATATSPAATATSPAATATSPAATATPGVTPTLNPTLNKKTYLPMLIKQ